MFMSFILHKTLRKAVQVQLNGSGNSDRAVKSHNYLSSRLQTPASASLSWLWPAHGISSITFGVLNAGKAGVNEHRLFRQATPLVTLDRSPVSLLLSYYPFSEGCSTSEWAPFAGNSHSCLQGLAKPLRFGQTKGQGLSLLQDMLLSHAQTIVTMRPLSPWQGSLKIAIIQFTLIPRLLYFTSLRKEALVCETLLSQEIGVILHPRDFINSVLLQMHVRTWAVPQLGISRIPTFTLVPPEAGFV